MAESDQKMPRKPWRRAFDLDPVDEEAKKLPRRELLMELIWKI
jgi:hypothetical protein